MKHAIRTSSASILLVLAATAFAQKMTMTSMVIGPGGNTVANAGQTVSKKGVQVEFEAYMDADKHIAGYKLSEPGMKGLVVGDRIHLFVPGLKLLPGEIVGFARVSGVGAWTAVTIKSIQTAEGVTTITFKEKLTLDNGSGIQQLDYQVSDGYLVPKPSSSPMPR